LGLRDGELGAAAAALKWRDMLCHVPKINRTRRSASLHKIDIVTFERV
jgi:hypothetical protein